MDITWQELFVRVLKTILILGIPGLTFMFTHKVAKEQFIIVEDQWSEEEQWMYVKRLVFCLILLLALPLEIFLMLVISFPL